MKDSNNFKTVLIIFTVIAIVVVGISGQYTMEAIGAGCKMCAMDVMICIGGGRIITAIILPVSILCYCVVILNYRYHYNYIIKYENKLNILFNLLKTVFLVSVFAVIVAVSILGITGYIKTGVFCNYKASNSLFANELYSTKTLYTGDYNVVVMLVKSVVLAIMEVFSRVLSGLVLYLVSDMEWLAIISELAFSFLVPFRMAGYLNNADFKAAGGAFYTELVTGSIYWSVFIKLFIFITFIFLLMTIVMRRKNFYRA